MYFLRLSRYLVSLAKMPMMTMALGVTIALPKFSLVFGAATGQQTVIGGDNNNCHGQVCHPVEEYCSNFNEACDKCSNICDTESHNYNANSCASACAEYKRYEPLTAEIHAIQTQQSIMLGLLIVLLALIVVRYAYKCVRWVRHRRCFALVLKKLRLKKQQQQQQQHAMQNSKDVGGTTIQNVMTISEIERAPSQIYSVTAGAEGSVMTVTTPVSTRYPAENSTTPTMLPTEYSYDNQALAVTPISEKPNVTPGF